jgi:acetylornithine deacetylase/succinyl-diaminopimelate desuccinylase-like protein
MATAKVDSRLPMGIDHETALASIRQHLDGHGYGDIDIRLLGGYPAAQTSIDSPLVKATRFAIGQGDYRRHAQAWL